MPLQTQLTAQALANLTGAADHGVPKANLSLTLDVALASGTAANQADRVWSDQRTLIASATEDLDLAGALAGALGEADVFVKIKAILIKAAAANTNNVVVGNGTNGFVGPFGAVAHTLAVPPGGAAMLLAPVNGWTVTPGTGDILKITNSAAGTPVTYDIMVVGTSA